MARGARKGSGKGKGATPKGGDRAKGAAVKRSKTGAAVKRGDRGAAPATRAVVEASPGEGWQSPGVLAEVLGVSVQHFQRHYQPMVPEGDLVRRGRRVWIRGRALLDVWVGREVERREAEIAAGRRPVEGGPIDEEMLAGGAGSSPALERYRDARAQVEELNLLERRRELMRRDRVHELLGRLASILRGTGERLQREFGPEAFRLFDESIDNFERGIRDGFAE